MRRGVRVTALLACLQVPVTAMAAPDVVTSILPLQSLTAMVMDGIGEPTTLLPAGASPHAYALRPSEAARLERADLVVWVGPDLERFLERPLANLAGSAEHLALLDVDGIVLLPTRAGGVWDRHAHDHDGGHDHAHDHEDDHAHDDDGDHAHDHAHEDHHHGSIDAHLWLQPDNARAAVRAIAATLARLDPANAETYAANAAGALATLDSLKRELDAELAPVRERPFIVFHDAYRYFEAAFDLSGAGSVTVAPEVQPGTAQLAELRERIMAADAVCVFAEPQFQPQLVEMLTAGTPARTGVLDPIGVDLEPGPEAYATLLHNLADALVACLAEPS